MTTQVLYHALGVDSYAATRCWEKEGVFCLQMEAPLSCHRCSKCGCGDVIHRGTFDRTVHAPPIGTCRTQLFSKGPRLECRRYQQVLNAAIPKVVPHCQYTESFARLVIDLRKMLTIQDVARCLGVSETMIRSIDKKYLPQNFGKPRLRDLKIIAIFVIEPFFPVGLIQRDDPFPQKKMGCEDHGRIAANDRSMTHRAAFRFKWKNGRERFCVPFCRGMVRRRGEELSLDFRTLLRTGIGVESAAPNHPKAPGGNVFEPA